MIGMGQLESVFKEEYVDDIITLDEIVSEDLEFLGITSTHLKTR